MKEYQKTPSLFGVYFYAVLIALLGALLGFVYMTTFPAQAFSSEKAYSVPFGVVEEASAHAKPGDAYFIEGPVLQSRSWELKREQMQATGSQRIAFSAGEINAWMAAKFRPGAAPAGDEAPDLLILPGVPNVAFSDEGILYLNIPTTITAYGTTYDYTIFSRCTLATSGIQFQSVNISSAKVPLPNLIGARVFETLSKGYQSTKEYAIIAEAFARADSVKIERAELVFDLR